MPSIGSDSIIFGTKERDSSYLIKIGRMHDNNIFPYLGILKYKNIMKIKHDHFEKAREELFKNNNFESIVDYITNYMKRKKRKIKIKTKLSKPSSK